MNLEGKIINKYPNSFINYKPLSDVLVTEKNQKYILENLNNLYNSKEFENYLASVGFSNIYNKTKTIKKINYTKVLENNAMKILLSNRLITTKNKTFALLIPITKNVSDIVKINNPQIMVINKAKDLSDLFKKFRYKTIIALAGAATIISLLSLFYFGYKKTIKLVLLPLSSALFATLLTYVLGFNISLFTILAILLILGIGFDYVIFLESCNKLKNNLLIDKTIKSIILSSSTTILSFGLLALSKTAVIASFGITIIFGIIIILLVSPAIIKTTQTIK